MTHNIQAPNQTQISRLLHSYAHGAPPHALCLIGSANTSKEQLGDQLAASLLCLDADKRPCTQCNGCRRVREGTHANLIRLALGNKERSIKIDSLRRLLDVLSLHPQENGPRVIVINEVDAMTVQAQNALLKSLEEPEASDFFILTASIEQSVLPTIRSRCEIHKLSDNGSFSFQNDNIEAIAGVSADVLTLAENTFFSVRRAVDVPSASGLLRDEKEHQAALLDLVEQQAVQCLKAQFGQAGNERLYWSHAATLALRRVLSAVFEARKYSASNVSWHAVADRLLFTITKEIYQCPLS